MRDDKGDERRGGKRRGKEFRCGFMLGRENNLVSLFEPSRDKVPGY